MGLETMQKLNVISREDYLGTTDHTEECYTPLELHLLCILISDLPYLSKEIMRYSDESM